MDIDQLRVGKGYLKENLTELHIIVRTTGLPLFLFSSSKHCNVRESQLSVAQFVWVRPAVVTSSLIQPSALLCGVGRRERWRGWI